MPKKLPALDDFDHSTEATESTPTPKQSTTALKKSKAAPAMISGKEVSIVRFYHNNIYIILRYYTGAYHGLQEEQGYIAEVL